jgi:hypothetical protein
MTDAAPSRRAAAFIGCKTEELVLTRCTTEGMKPAESRGTGGRVNTPH